MRRIPRKAGDSGTRVPWNRTLQYVREIEVRIGQHAAATDPGPATCTEDFQQLARELEAIWADPATNARLKKRIVRALFEEIFIDEDGSAGELVLTTSLERRSPYRTAPSPSPPRSVQHSDIARVDRRGSSAGPHLRR